MVAKRWGWDTAFMITHFGWKAAVGIFASNALYLAAFWGEFRTLGARAAERAAKEEQSSHPVPAWIVAVHLAFLALTVFAAHTPGVFVGGFLFFLAFQSVTAPHQQRMDLQPPLLVGFFLAGLVVHGAGQTWWIAPVLSHLDTMPLFVGATLLTAFNDNAAITYLASLVPGFSPALQYAVVAGAVTGGGLTVIANAPNPAGQAALARYFPQGVSPMRLLAGALLPTGVMAACFLLL
jgi:Na+/H+ antiporter NhaD/arsenite permease-like protein